MVSLRVVPTGPALPVPQSLDSQPDDALMLLARDGELAAFDVLVRRHQAKALRVAKKYSGHDTMAAEAAQSALFEIYRALPRYLPQGKFEAYLFRVVINECRMVQRRGRRDSRLHEAVSQLGGDQTQGPEADVLAQERHRQLERAVGRLSPKLRAVVVLRFGADLSYTEIAETLQVPLGTVKRRLFDALERMRKGIRVA